MPCCGAGELLSAVGRRERFSAHDDHVLTQLAYDGVASGRSLVLVHVNPVRAAVAESEKCLRFMSRIRANATGAVAAW